MSSNLLEFAIQRSADVVQVEVVSILSGHQPKPHPERAAYVAKGAFDLHAGLDPDRYRRRAYLGGNTEETEEHEGGNHDRWNGHPAEVALQLERQSGQVDPGRVLEMDPGRRFGNVFHYS
jgi:hypothetical protein